MNLSKNPSLILFQMQQMARVTMNGVQTSNQKNKEHIEAFKNEKSVLLFYIDSLSIRARFENNNAPYTIIALKISAAPWSNGKNDETIDCKIKLKLELIFNTVSPVNTWESSLFSIDLIPDSFTLSNKEMPEKSLTLESANKFNELSDLIRKGVKEIGMSYPLVEEK